MIFVAQKSITCLKLWQTLRNDFAMHARTLRYHANVSRRFCKSIRKPITNSSHPSEIGALTFSTPYKLSSYSFLNDILYTISRCQTRNVLIRLQGCTLHRPCCSHMYGLFKVDIKTNLGCLDCYLSLFRQTDRLTSTKLT